MTDADSPTPPEWLTSRVFALTAEGLALFERGVLRAVTRDRRMAGVRGLPVAPRAYAEADLLGVTGVDPDPAVAAAAWMSIADLDGPRSLEWREEVISDLLRRAERCTGLKRESPSVRGSKLTKGQGPWLSTSRRNSAAGQLMKSSL